GVAEDRSAQGVRHAVPGVLLARRAKRDLPCEPYLVLPDGEVDDAGGNGVEGEAGVGVLLTPSGPGSLGRSEAAGRRQAELPRGGEDGFGGGEPWRAGVGFTCPVPRPPARPVDDTAVAGDVDRQVRVDDLDASGPLPEVDVRRLVVAAQRAADDGEVAHVRGGEASPRRLPANEIERDLHRIAVGLLLREELDLSGLVGPGRRGQGDTRDEDSDR